MKNLIATAILLSGMFASSAEAKDLVAYFSAQGNTKAVAERIAELTGADLFRIEAADPYAENPYDDSDRIQNEAYNDLRPAVANLPSQEWIDGYDRIFIGSPCWWHQPAMVVCTFLENYDLSKHVIIPFFTYGATTYLNESMQKIYKCTPDSRHVPETLTEDLDSDDITRPGRPDDSDIAMPGNAAGVERWLERFGLTGETGISAAGADEVASVRVSRDSDTVHVTVAGTLLPDFIDIYGIDGTRIGRLTGNSEYSFSSPARSVYRFSIVCDAGMRRVQKNVAV